MFGGGWVGGLDCGCGFMLMGGNGGKGVMGRSWGKGDDGWEWGVMGGALLSPPTLPQ